MEEYKKNAFTRLRYFAKNNRKELYLSMLYAVLGVLLSIVPYFCAAKIIIGLFYKTATAKFIFYWGIIAIACYIGKQFFSFLSTAKSHEVAFGVLKNIRINISEKMQRLPMGVMIDRPSGEHKNLIVDTVETLEKPLAHMLPEISANVITPMLTLFIIFIIDWRMGLATIIPIPIGLMVMMLQMIGFKEKSEKYYSANADMSNTINEYINGIEVIKTFGRGVSSYQKFTNSCIKFRDIVLDWGKLSWVFNGIGFSIIGTTLFVILPLGTYLLMNKSLDFSSFVITVILSFGVAGPLMAATSFIDSLANVSYLRRLIKYGIF